METLVASILAVVGLAEIYVLIYLVALPRQARRRTKVRRLERANVFLALFFVISLAGQFALNGPAYAENIAYDIRMALGGEDELPGDEPILHVQQAAAAVTAPEAGEDLTLIIPKTNVRTPIVFPTDTSTQGVLKSLEKGVGAYPGSVLPGQKGHMVLLGHSSLASWYNGDYARVFALLKELEIGDEFIIESEDGTKYVYKIFANQVFKPAAADVYLSGPAAGSVVDLVTCDPVGSASNRRIVSAALQGAAQ